MLLLKGLWDAGNINAKLQAALLRDGSPCELTGRSDSEFAEHAVPKLTKDTLVMMMHVADQRLSTLLCGAVTEDQRIAVEDNPDWRACIAHVGPFDLPRFEKYMQCDDFCAVIGFIVASKEKMLRHMEIEQYLCLRRADRTRMYSKPTREQEQFIKDTQFNPNHQFMLLKRKTLIDRWDWITSEFSKSIDNNEYINKTTWNTISSLTLQFFSEIRRSGLEIGTLRDRVLTEANVLKEREGDERE